jgi:hypothetical protein
MGIVLETQRLILKTPELSDLDDLIALRTDPDVMQYINDESIQTIGFISQKENSSTSSAFCRKIVRRHHNPPTLPHSLLWQLNLNAFFITNSHRCGVVSSVLPIQLYEKFTSLLRVKMSGWHQSSSWIIFRSTRLSP